MPNHSMQMKIHKSLNEPPRNSIGNIENNMNLSKEIEMDIIKHTYIPYQLCETYIKQT